MAFTAEQMEALVAPVPTDMVRRREIDGRQLPYIEGWFALAEANRIFGFHG
jgi:DNA repair and recombination protein RAD52